MKIRRIVSAAMALLLACAMPLSAMADEWDLSTGDITINVDDSGNQTVSQVDNATSSGGIAIGAPPKADSNPTINSNGQTSNTIKVSTVGNHTANATIDGVNINTSSGSGIEVNGNLSLTVKGDNTISTSVDSAAIHVKGGDLTITGDGKLSATNTGNGAAIGSNKDEEMSGSITIQGDVTVDATNQANNDPDEDPSIVSSGIGAAIGSGANGAMSGDITVGGNAQVTAQGNDGAAIGSGENGTMSGEISVGGNASLTATSFGNGAGIGSGNQDPSGNAPMSGSITINGNTTVNAEGNGTGAAIGSGTNSAMSGSITIGGSTNTNATSTGSGAGIGSGNSGAVSGNISINGNANVEASATTGAAIGSGASGSVSADGTISIRGDSKVTTVNSDQNPEDNDPKFGASIGSGANGAMKGTIEIGNRATLSGDGGIVIGAGNGGEMGGKIVYVTEPTATDADTDTAEPLYRVVDKDEKDLPFTAERKDGVLTVKCARDYATFLAKTGNLRILKARGIKTIVFETNGTTSTFDLEDLLAEGSGTCYLTHDGATVTFTLEETDVSDILK